MKFLTAVLLASAAGFAAADIEIVGYGPAHPDKVAELGKELAQGLETVLNGGSRRDRQLDTVTTTTTSTKDVLIFKPGDSATIDIPDPSYTETYLKCGDIPGWDLILPPVQATDDCVKMVWDFVARAQDDDGNGVLDVIFNSASTNFVKNGITQFAKDNLDSFIIGNVKIVDMVMDITGVEGDPHFLTLGGKWYDYMGACDLKMIHAPKFDGETSLDVNVRTKIRYDYSYVESAVLKLGNDTLEVASYGDYFLNGVAGAQMPAFVGGYPVTHSNPSKKIHIFTIQLNEKESIVMKNFKDMVAVQLNTVHTRFAGSLGMVGSADNEGKLLGRDGKTEFEDPNAFADEWQIRADEPMLFSAAKGPQAPEKCQLPSPAAAKGRRLGETIALEAAEKACAKWAADNIDNCVHDVMAIGDLELAAAGAF